MDILFVNIHSNEASSCYRFRVFGKPKTRIWLTCVKWRKISRINLCHSKSIMSLGYRLVSSALSMSYFRNKLFLIFLLGNLTCASCRIRTCNLLPTIPFLRGWKFHLGLSPLGFVKYFADFNFILILVKFLVPYGLFNPWLKRAKI